MQVRMPRIDYSAVVPNWGANLAFTHQVNAYSTIPPYIEPWLIKVLQEAKPLIPAADTELRVLVDWFIGQEAQHYRQHKAFNRCLAQRYPQIAVHEKRLADEFDDMLRNRSLKFKLAYSEGFETLGPPAAQLWFEEYDALLEGADPAAVAMWKWHMAEEFEHREVCHRLFHTLYSRGIWGRFWNGWLFRIYGVFYAMKHLRGHKDLVMAEMLAADRANMNEEEHARSVQEEADLKQFHKDKGMAALRRILSPFYSPMKLPTPRGVNAYLKRFERGGEMAAAA